ncbi:hypothetical protein MASR2M12_05330 [Bacteroidales bacterium]
MPGLAICCNFSELEIQSALNQFPRADYPVIQQEFNVGQGLFVAAFTYPDYPFLHWQRGECLVFAEGKTYPFDPDGLRDDCFSWFTDDGFRLRQIEKWVEKQDGEFVILLINKLLQKGLIFNDRFGRLPLYLLREQEKWCISREIGFTSRFTQHPKPDKGAMAENLLFGYPLGDKTFDERVRRIPSSAQIIFDLPERKFSCQHSLPIWDGRQKTDFKIINRLLNILGQAIANRLEANPNLTLSLSGGLDSRLIAAILKRQDIDIQWITYRDAEGSAEPDVIAARKIAEQLQHSRFETIGLPLTKAENVCRLLQLKNGMNGADMAFLIPFLELFQQNQWQMMSGDGGDKTLESLRPPIPLMHQNQLLSLLLWKHRAPSIASVAAILDVEIDFIKNSLRESLKPYELKRLENQYEMFLFHERAVHWLFEGEDRNRSFCWTTSPFYQPEFWETAMEIRMQDKSFGKLFVELFRQLPGNLDRLENPNWRLAPTQGTQLKYLQFKQSLKAGLNNFSVFQPRTGIAWRNLPQTPNFEWFAHFVPLLTTSPIWQRAEKELLTPEIWLRLLSISLPENQKS